MSVVFTVISSWGDPGDPGERVLRVINRASHYDLYDVVEYVDLAVAQLGAFFGTYLRSTQRVGETAPV